MTRNSRKGGEQWSDLLKRIRRLEEKNTRVPTPDISQEEYASPPIRIHEISKTHSWNLRERQGPSCSENGQPSKGQIVALDGLKILLNERQEGKKKAEKENLVLNLQKIMKYIIKKGIVGKISDFVPIIQPKKCIHFEKISDEPSQKMPTNRSPLVTGYCARLEKTGWICFEADKKDKRIKNVKLSDEFLNLK